MRGFRSLTVAAVFAVTVLLLAATPAFAGTTLPQDDIWYDNTQALKNIAPPAQTAMPGSLLNEILAAGEVYDEATADLILTLFSDDPNNPETFDVAFWKEYEGEHADIYIGWNDLTPPEASSQQDHEITAEQIAYMGAEFDQKIWESDVFHFGNYAERDLNGALADGSRAAIFVYNIRDEAYYSDYPYYIAGYFWGGFNDAFDINAIFIDSYNWKDRLGEDVARPYLYEGVVAHEFQHLIHHDVDPDEDSFVDEGMACIAEQLLYGNYASAGQIGSYLWLHRDSLITWNGVALEDYGSVTLWSDYLWEQVPGYEARIPMMAPLADRVAPGFEDDMFAETDAKFADPGDALIWNIMHNQTNGLLGQAECIPGGMEEVERLFHDWTLANLLDGKVVEPQWNYTNLEIGTEDSDFVTIDTGINFYKTGYNYAMPTMKPAERRAMTQPWGAYYRYLKATKKPVTVVFTGEEATGLPPTTGTYEWYGGMGALLTNTLTRQIDGVPAGATLDFLTWFDIEAEWDYGYVEASSDGVNWSVLPQLSALPTATEDVNGSTAFDGVGGFTGNSDGWQPASFDLAGFEGTVFVRFRYMTDEAVNGQGWYVDDISVGNAEGDVFVDPCDSENGWVSVGWSFTTGLQANDWTADTYAAYAEGAPAPYLVKTLVGPEVEPGLAGRAVMPTAQIKGKIYGIVSNHPDGTFAAPARITITKGLAKRR